MAKKRREYLLLLEKSKEAALTAVNLHNSVFQPYRNEATLILLSNAWELAAKAVLVKSHKTIQQSGAPIGYTITGEIAVFRLKTEGALDELQEDLIQQIISLRNAATHHILPRVPIEVMHHLLYYGCKFYRAVIEKYFPAHLKDLPDNFLSLSFGDLTTYADRVQKLVSKVRKSADERKLVWLLERGVSFDGSKYISQSQFEQKYRNKRGLMKHLDIADFIDKSEMVRLVALQAPKNFTADITLRKGKSNTPGLPVAYHKTDPDADYPYFTADIAAKLGKNVSFVAKMGSVAGIRGNSTFHQAIRSSKKSSIQKYSEAGLQKMKEILIKNPDFNPYKL